MNLLPLEYVYVRTQWQIARSKILTGNDPSVIEVDADGSESSKSGPIKNNFGAPSRSSGLTIGSPTGWSIAMAKGTGNEYDGWYAYVRAKR